MKNIISASLVSVILLSMNAINAFTTRISTSLSLSSSASTSTSTSTLQFHNKAIAIEDALISNTNLNLFISNKDKTNNGTETFSKITNVHSPREFLDFLNEDDRLCIVKFYASWCKSCKKFDIRLSKFIHLVADQQDAKGNLLQKGSVRVAKVEIAANAKLCKKLNITKLPYIQLYRGDDGLIDGFACPPKEFHVLVDTVNACLDDVHLEVDDDAEIYNA